MNLTPDRSRFDAITFTEDVSSEIFPATPPLYGSWGVAQCFYGRLLRYWVEKERGYGHYASGETKHWFGRGEISTSYFPLLTVTAVPFADQTFALPYGLPISFVNVQIEPSPLETTTQRLYPNPPNPPYLCEATDLVESNTVPLTLTAGSPVANPFDSSQILLLNHWDTSYFQDFRFGFLKVLHFQWIRIAEPGTFGSDPVIPLIVAGLLPLFALAAAASQVKRKLWTA
jgi:hypothetical protein